jgi:hypothetical protein
VDHAVPLGVMAARLHNACAEMAVRVALAGGETRMMLTGGCFQNRVLTERTVDRLEAAGVRPYWHQRVPPNDGGISAGQVAAWLRARAAVSVGEPGHDIVDSTPMGLVPASSVVRVPTPAPSASHSVAAAPAR